jgi:hypothetical protein
MFFSAVSAVSAVSAFKGRVVVPIVALGAALWLAPGVDAQRGGRGGAPQGPPPTAKAAAPIDISGYWVSLVTDDWRWRMMTPPKGDYLYLPLNQTARQAADTWDPAKDEAAGEQCKGYSAPSLMHLPGRLHITWQDDNTLKLEFDAGTQTRLLRFVGNAPTTGERTWQGYSAAVWEVGGQQLNLDRNGIPVAAGAGGGAGGGGGGGRGRGRGPAVRGGSLRVVTTYMRDGYLRKNGVPYSGNAVVTEYFDRLGPEPNGDVILNVRTVVEDSKYLQGPFITSTNFKLERDGSKWNPTPCKTDPPSAPTASQ